MNVTDSTAPRTLRLAWVDGALRISIAFGTLADIADTTRPIAPDTMAWPITGAPLLRSPDDSAVTYYRTLVSVEFGDTASGVTIRSVLAKYRATVVGGYRADPSGSKGYVLQVPDPGPSMSALDTLIAYLQAEPGIAFAHLNALQAPISIRGRHPN